MNKLSALALSTALALSMPLAALAQDAGVGVTLDGGVSTELGGEDAGVDVGVDAGAEAGVEAGAEVSGDADADATSSYTYGDLDAALQGAGTADLSGVTAETEIEIVEVGSLGEDGDFTAAAYGEARAGYDADIGVLQSNVEANADIVAAIEAAGYASDDVVGVWSQADGSLTVFVESGKSHEAEAAEQSGLDADAEAGAAANGEVTAQ